MLAIRPRPDVSRLPNAHPIERVHRLVDQVVRVPLRDADTPLDLLGRHRDRRRLTTALVLCERPDRRQFLFVRRLGRPDVTQRGQLSFDRIEPLAIRCNLPTERSPGAR